MLDYYCHKYGHILIIVVTSDYKAGTSVDLY